VRMLVYLADLSACLGSAGRPVTSVQALSSLLFGGGSSPSAPSLAAHLASCSSGAATLDLGASRVLPVVLPCSGTSTWTDAPWNTASCSSDNVFGWMEAATRAASAVVGDPTTYQQHVLVLPPGLSASPSTGCSWAGLSTVGPVVLASGARMGLVWVEAGSWADLKVYMHELGHTAGFQHANAANQCDTCDPHSTLGAWGSGALRCYNAPQQWALGWAAEQATGPIDLSMAGLSALMPGRTLALTLPAAAAGPPSQPPVLRITLSPSQPSLFISFRANNVSSLYDTYIDVYTQAWLGTQPGYVPPRPGSPPRPWPNTGGLDAQGTALPLSAAMLARLAPSSSSTTALTWALAVHSWAQSPLEDLDPNYNPNPTVLQGLVQREGGVWYTPLFSGPGAGQTLVVRLLSASRVGASISVCVTQVTSESGAGMCSDGLDNDCDGLTDAADPQCSAVASATTQAATQSAARPLATVQTQTSAAAPVQTAAAEQEAVVPAVATSSTASQAGTLHWVAAASKVNSLEDGWGVDPALPLPRLSTCRDHDDRR
ncbi:Gametolysin peptidase M11-domain-containing protein, partial [Haematococcus lacustris]